MDANKRPICYFLCLSWLLGGLAVMVAIRPIGTLAQGEITATPDSEGIIYSQVRPNDSLWSIAARAGISLPELLTLNNLSENAIIQPGQQLIIGHGTPGVGVPTATGTAATLTNTPTLAPPTPRPTATLAPQTALCLQAFEDTNRDGRRGADEPLKAAVAFTIFSEDIIVNYITDGIAEPYCLPDLPAGNYQVTRSIGRNEVLTTDGQLTITLVRGNVLQLEFGSYVASGVGLTATGSTPEAPAASLAEGEDRGGVEILTSKFVSGTVALVLLLVFGVVLFAMRNRKSTPRL
jgi:hypothetical protein